jgi:hypothetical protein
MIVHPRTHEIIRAKAELLICLDDLQVKYRLTPSEMFLLLGALGEEIQSLAKFCVKFERENSAPSETPSTRGQQRRSSRP